MNASSRIPDGAYEFLAVLGLASLIACSRGENQGTSRPVPSVPPVPSRVAPLAPIAPSASSPSGAARGAISFVALPNAGIRVLTVGTAKEIPLPGRTTPLHVSLAPGIYRVELTFPGAGPAARDVTVDPGRTIAVKVEDPRFDVEKLVSGAAAAGTEAALRSGLRLFFRGDYDGCVKTLSRLSAAGDATARLFTAYAMAGSVLAGGREAGPELQRARVLYESVPARARPAEPPGVSPRILEALAAVTDPLRRAYSTP